MDKLDLCGNLFDPECVGHCQTMPAAVQAQELPSCIDGNLDLFLDFFLLGPSDTLEGLLEQVSGLVARTETILSNAVDEPLHILAVAVDLLISA